MSKILIVENDADTLEMLSIILQEQGHTIVQTAVAISVEKIIVINPDIILLDYYLDNSYGSDFCLEVKTHPLTKHTPVLLISTTLDILKISNDCLADGYISKPFELKHLERKVKKMLAA